MDRRSALQAFGLCAALLSSCHDSPRRNPLDPELTAPVGAEVTLDDSAGAAVVTWSRYDGAQPFTEYRVVRNVIDQTTSHTMAVVADIDSLRFVDRSLNLDLAYEYRVVVVNTSGFSAASPPVRLTPRSLPAAEITDVEFDPKTATSRVAWTAYEGPRFASYVLERRTEGLTPVQVFGSGERVDTSFVDTGLEGGIEYFYRVVVETSRQERVASSEVGAVSFFLVQDSWPLDVADGSFVRLYREEDGLTALVAAQEDVRLLRYAADGTLVEEQTLVAPVEAPFTWRFGIEPESVATSVLDGQRFLTMMTGVAARDLAVLRFDLEGNPLPYETDVLPELTAGLSPIDDAEGGLITICLGCDAFTGEAAFDNLRLYSGSGSSFIEDFTTPSDQLRGQVEDGWAFLADAGGSRSSSYSVEDEAWRDIGLELDLFPSVGLTSTIELFVNRSGVDFSSYRWNLRRDIPFQFNVVHDGEAGDFEIDFNMVMPVTRLGMELSTEGVFRTWIRDPTLWNAAVGPQRFNWGTMAVVQISAGAKLAFTVGEQANLLDELAVPHTGRTARLELGIGELRNWREPDRAAPGVGISVPRDNQVYVDREISTLFSRNTIANYATGAQARGLGRGVGSEAGQFLYPLSLDVDAVDGRVYVLDAGNHRIQVFDLEGNYVTRWGRRGTDPGSFDFGEGARPEEFTGSLTVDDKGAIYVADVGNRRIQKFVP